MRNLKKASFFLFVVAAISISRIGLQVYCNVVHGADASVITGCVPGLSGSGDSMYPIMHQTGEGARYRLRGINKQDKGPVDHISTPSSRNSSNLERPVPIASRTLQPIPHGETAENTVVLKGNVPAEKPKRVPCVKRVLFWADPSLEKLKTYLSTFQSKRVFCRDIDCTAQLTISMDWEDLATNDVVVFYHKVHKDWKELMRRRPSGQIWMFFTREAPSHTTEWNNFPEGISHNIHNWTMLYLAGSDLYTIYGRFVPKSAKSIQRTVNKPVSFHRNKTNFCAWVASNCKYTSWDRMGFVKALQEHMSVDIYGKCGDLVCPKDCRPLLTKYKFYLALESHTCRDYITEKVWKNAFEQNTIPVVYGAPKVDYERSLPPKSFIHVDDFESFEELTKFLLRVADDEEEYNSYFAWKSKGAIKRETSSSFFSGVSLCGITRKLLAVDKGEDSSNWNNRSIKDWWRGSCFDAGNPMVYR